MFILLTETNFQLQFVVGIGIDIGVVFSPLRQCIKRRSIVMGILQYMYSPVISSTVDISLSTTTLVIAGNVHFSPCSGVQDEFFNLIVVTSNSETVTGATSKAYLHDSLTRKTIAQTVAASVFCLRDMSNNLLTSL